MYISFVVVLRLSFIYLFGKCLLHPGVGQAQRKGPRIHRAKTKLLPISCHTVFRSATVIVNTSISKSNTEYFEHRHCLLHLCVMRARLRPQQGIDASVLRIGQEPLKGGCSCPGPLESQMVCWRDEVNMGRPPSRDGLALLYSESI